MLNYNQKLMLRRAERRILEKKKIRERLNKSGWNGIDFLNDRSTKLGQNCTSAVFLLLF